VTEGSPGRDDVRRAFEDALASIDRTEGLVAAATAFARHELPNADARVVAAHLDALGARVVARAPSGSAEARLAHLHEVLFEEEGFAGNAASYYDPLNSYLPAVLSTRLGIPISLALVYRAVGERAGLRVEGLGAPGHFFVRVAVEGGPAIVDPFAGGRVLTAAEARTRVEAALGRDVPPGADLFPVVTNVAWLSRMLRNLEVVFSATARTDDVLAMRALRACLPGERL
jgi:regulator of sirC expression with transglutaminase-like and TPR domain